MVRKSDTPAYFASPASASPGAPEGLPRIPGAILQKSSKPRPEPSPAAAESLPVGADLAMARAQAAKGNPVILEIKNESEKRGEKRGLAKGKVEGIAESILMFLQARSLKLSEEQRERILATTDRETLDRWVRRAASASSLDDVFGEE